METITVYTVNQEVRKKGSHFRVQVSEPFFLFRI